VPKVPVFAASAPVRIGVSSCLLGNEVRYDGGHKRDAFLVGTFGPYVEWVPVCPEVEIGLGIPRPTLRLVQVDGQNRLIRPSDGGDYTEPMLAYARRRVRALDGLSLCGYVLKKDSPSCGMERVKIYSEGRMPMRSGRGLFATILLEHFPNLPVEEEGRLNDPTLRENFIERVFAYQRVRAFFAERWTVGQLVAFHTAHKLQIMAHSPAAYTDLGRLVAAAKTGSRSALREQYEDRFMRALHITATRARHSNVLQHMAGYFKRSLDPPARQELAALIDDYRRGLVPLIVPMTLVRHYVRLLAVAYLDGQVYLQPHPKEMMLRNHV